MIRSTSYHKLNRKSSSLAIHPKNKGRKKDVLEKFIESPQPLLGSSLSQLRHSILCEGLPDPCPYRAYIWCILLRASPIESEWYSGVVARGEVNTESMGVDSKFAHISEKIRNDVFRTFQNNKKFWSKTSEDEFIRVLNAFAWCVIENDEINELSNVKNSRLSPYVQGMNVLAGPFLYVCRSEPQSFTLFYNLLIVQMPRYVTPTLIGAMDGVRLVELVLNSVDKKLSEFLKKSMSSAKIYALPSVLTLCACTPSLDEVVKLWDFLFSYGVHMNIILVVAQLLLIRSELLTSKNPMSLLRQFPELDARKIIKLSLSITKSIPDDLYDLIVRHTFDETVGVQIENYKT
ncbi:hypothetical protein PICMEDRAFT_60430 [Pichia membranifaciens NRRL Y-2026]|uniref:Rab-GAP TBC domain-containing protein n=1 Tax=Pichia membranifaciens NRRL Y-2026 TaxID=763406 RepID=A0A1E3NF88_9ASCO|nr:hypothetical protein PICMEDRAFT_60430 [Pichia membranifaciens NRRL Y-2026]ODQ44792.1 hypothetical protein PICMEDRAFT_60430 [Pichia membranifaciens NRRL Y-2026]